MTVRKWAWCPICQKGTSRVWRTFRGGWSGCEKRRHRRMSPEGIQRRRDARYNKRHQRRKARRQARAVFEATGRWPSWHLLEILQGRNPQRLKDFTWYVHSRMFGDLMRVVDNRLAQSPAELPKHIILAQLQTEIDDGRAEDWAKLS